MPDVLHPAHTAGGIFSNLDAEWVELCADPAVHATVTDWLVADQLTDAVVSVTDGVPERASCHPGPAELLAALRTRDRRMADTVTDAVLRSLLRRAAGRDRSATLAARVIVQTMIPAAVRMTRGQVRPFGGRSFEAVASVTVAALFEVARSGRIHTRPGRPAANLALDTLRYVCRELAADREERGEDLAAAEAFTDSGCDPAEAAEACAVHSAAAVAGLHPVQAVSATSRGARLELLELVLEALDAGTLTHADGRAITWHYSTEPVTDTDAAARNNTTAGAWQRRRSRAVARLTASLA
ncbi:hypothetical protein [Streptomyces sp. NPDC048565]|uniref:hypothetical protein n=1 Tax=Streptomyces sp. NPDC048565 TaxID=3155266 RepID=UPI0034302660